MPEIDDKRMNTHIDHDAMPTSHRKSGWAALWQWRWRPRVRKRIFDLMMKTARSCTALLPPVAQLALRNAREVTRSLDYPGADIRISAESWVEYDKRAHSCSKEPETVEWIERYIEPGEVVYDIGANVGAYALLAGRVKQAKVYAFEPSFSTFAQLSRNVALNNLSERVAPMYVALADKTALIHFNYSSLETGTALHALGAAGEFRPVHRQPILSFSLDDLVEQFGLEYPQHIKLDVDGIEHAILKGASKVLAHPGLRSIIVETEETRDGSSDIGILLREAGFSLASVHVHNSNPLHLGPYVRNCIYSRSQIREDISQPTK